MREYNNSEDLVVEDKTIYQQHSKQVFRSDSLQVKKEKKPISYERAEAWGGYLEELDAGSRGCLIE